MECENCERPLKYHDYKYIGNYAAYLNGRPDSGFQVVSDVYQCENEDCEAYREAVEITR